MSVPSPAAADRRAGRSGGRPPRIAVFADIHGNLPALLAVLADIAEQGVDEVLVGGDLVGRGPQGSAVTRAIRDSGWPSVRGNHEDYLLGFRRGEVPAEWLVTEQWAASRWMAAELTTEDETYLDALPFSLASSLEPELRLVHGSPRAANEGIGPWTSDQQVAAHLSCIAEPVLVCCHTHRPMLREVDEGLVVNVGSVGLPFNRDTRAQYVIFQRAAPATGEAAGATEDAEVTLAGGWRVEWRRVPYDLEETLHAYRETGFRDQGGVTAHLLEMELRHATSYLVPFLNWAEASRVEPSVGEIEAFQRFYRPDEPLQEFFRRLRALL